MKHWFPTEVILCWGIKVARYNAVLKKGINFSNQGNKDNILRMEKNNIKIWNLKELTVDQVKLNLEFH